MSPCLDNTTKSLHFPDCGHKAISGAKSMPTLFQTKPLWREEHQRRERAMSHPVLCCNANIAHCPQPGDAIDSPNPPAAIMSEAKRKREPENDGLCPAPIPQDDENAAMSHDNVGDSEARTKRTRIQGYDYTDIPIDAAQMYALQGLAKSLQDCESTGEHIYQEAKAHRVAAASRRDTEKSFEARMAFLDARGAEIVALRVSLGYRMLEYILEVYDTSDEAGEHDVSDASTGGQVSDDEGSTTGLMPWAKKVALNAIEINGLRGLVESLQDRQSAMNIKYEKAKARRIATESQNDIGARCQAKLDALRFRDGLKALNYIIDAYEADKKGGASDEAGEKCESISSKGDGSPSPEKPPSPVF